MEPHFAPMSEMHSIRLEWMYATCCCVWASRVSRSFGNVWPCQLRSETPTSSQDICLLPDVASLLDRGERKYMQQETEREMEINQKK